MTRTNNPVISDGWVRAIFYLVSFFIFQILLSNLLSAIFLFFGNINPEKTRLNYLLVFQIANILLVISLTWLFRNLVDRKSYKSLGFPISHQWKNMLFGLLAGFTIMSIGFFTLLLLGNIKIKEITFLPSGLSTNILIFFIAAVSEEISIRGYVLNNLMQSSNKYVALIISSLIFCALHLFNPSISILSAFNIFLAGILLGIFYIHYQNLWFPIALHFGWNIFEGPIYGFEVSGITVKSIFHQSISGSDYISGGNFGLEGSVVATIILIIFIIIFQFIFKKPLDNEVSESTNAQ